MPLSVSAETVRAGPVTRKRTYDQITRSHSRSQTPTIPAKRRRTEPTEHRSTSPIPYSHPQPDHPVHRLEGDGLDYRRPTALAMAQAIDQTTIDLTLEDNTPPPTSPDSVENEDDDDDLEYLFDDTGFANEQPGGRAPPFNRQQGQNPTEPITISDSDDENSGHNETPSHFPESPEIQLVGERQLHRRLPSPQMRNLPPIHTLLRPNSQPDFRRTTPPELRRADAQSFRDTVRNAPGAILNFGRNILGAAMGPVHAPATASFAIAPLHGPHWLAGSIPTPLNPGIYDEIDDDDYGAIDLDYQDVGFPMGGLDIIDPTMDDAVAAAAAAAVEDAYKPPPVAREGFTRDIEEDGGVLVCVVCEDELATGEDEVKQQVWVARTCGHVFCGSCAAQRLTYRKGNDRERRRAKRPKEDQLKTCKAPSCDAKLTGKTAMFQVYL